jgi:predicted Rossmann fold flavoprotein
MFPRSDESREVVEALLRALHDSGATLRSPFRAVAMERLEDGAFAVTSDAGERLVARRLVVATGGLSLPKTGSDGAGLAMAARLGHARVPTYPALVPLLSLEPEWRELSGVSVTVRVSAERDGRRIEEREGSLLFTHRGFSGPVVLDMSRHVTQGGASLRAHWGGAAGGDWDRVLLESRRGAVVSALRRRLPARLASFLARRAGVDPAARLGELTSEVRARLVRVLSDSVLPICGSEGYAKAEVTGGGLSLAEVSPATLESRIVPGLHFCGEILDATGRLGGYNFLWAWVTGRKVGLALAAERGVGRELGRR